MEQNDEKHEEAHKRVRETCREHEGWLVRLERQISEQATHIATIRATPPEAAKLSFSPSVVFGIVAVSISLGASIWASNAGLRSDLRDVSNKIDNATKTADERERNQNVWKYDMQSQFKELQAQVKELADRIRPKP